MTQEVFRVLCLLDVSGGDEADDASLLPEIPVNVQSPVEEHDVPLTKLQLRPADSASGMNHHRRGQTSFNLGT